jgi:hypothetical protein
MPDWFEPWGIHMKRSTRDSKTILQISSSLSARLNAYALAAGAAGMGLLALAPPADAEVVYTPVHVVFDGSRTTYSIDVNNDGQPDFYLLLLNSAFCVCLQAGVARVFDGIEIKQGQHAFPLALSANAAIGPGEAFYGCVGSCGYVYLAFDSKHGYFKGNWINVSNRYLGLKFVVDGEQYYGWARMSVHLNKANHEITAVLTGYAYENIPNHGIPAGQTSGTFADRQFESESDSDSKPWAQLVRQASFEKSSESQTREAGSPGTSSVTLGVLALGAQGLPAWLR